MSARVTVRDLSPNQACWVIAADPITSEQRSAVDRAMVEDGRHVSSEHPGAARWYVSREDVGPLLVILGRVADVGSVHLVTTLAESAQRLRG